jgi:hypothetical protein
MNHKNEPLTMCKCNAGGRGVPAFSLCSTTANPSLTDDGFKMMFNKKAGLAPCRFERKPFQNPALHLHKPLTANFKK